jgi:hypothetical protein
MESSVYANARKRPMEAHIDLIVRVESISDVIDRIRKEEAASP